MSDTFEVRLRRIERYRFETDFRQDGVAPLVVDEPPPLGDGTGPNPARLLAAAVGDCLSASLVFCLSKSRVELTSLATTVTGSYVRNARNRLRIGRLDVTIEVGAEDPSKLERCLGSFEDFCIVTASVRAGLAVGVRVVDTAGNALHESEGHGENDAD